MPKPLLLSVVSLVAWAAAAAAALAHAQSPNAALANRLPGGANAVLTINVEKFLDSPFGKANELQAKLISGSADRPLAVPATARRVAVGAAVHPFGMRAIWEAAVIELSGTPKLDALLRQQGGYLDTIDGHPAAWTPRDAFYVALDEHALAVARPAQRQLVRMWLLGKDKPSLPAYITSALVTAGDADAVFAMDLGDVVGAPALRYAYGMGRFPSLEKVEGDTDALVQALASVRGMTITMRVADKINAQWVIDFEKPVAALGAQVEPFIVDVMTAADLYEPGVEQHWDFKVDGKRIVGTGTMELAGVNRMIALLSPVHVGDAEASTKVAAGGDAAATPGAGAAPAADARPASANDAQQRATTASQSYYRAVSKKLDTIGVKPSPQQGAAWLVAQARAIEQLPLLDVDPELAEWGATVANAFYRAAEELSVGQQRAQVASERVQTPVGQTAWTPAGGSTTDTPESRAAFKNAQKQRREAAQTERTAAAERAFNVFNEILPTRAKIRAAMVQKYGVEF